MDFFELINTRQSCRNYDSTRAVEKGKLLKLYEAARISPSACNGQPYHITVCTGDTALCVAKATMGMGINAFATDAPVLIVISEEPYVKTAALGAKLKGNDYRSMDIGILAAYITAAATELGLGSCILGWLDSDKIKEICSLAGQVRLVITIGYAKSDKIRTKKRKEISELITEID